MIDYEQQREEHLERVRRIAETLPPDAAISHESAAAVRGVKLYQLPWAVGVTRREGQHGFKTSDLHLRCVQLRPRDMTVVDGIRVTSLARTTLDLTRRLPFLQGLVVADSALRKGLRADALAEVRRHQWTWPGMARAHAALRHADGKADGPLESLVRGRVILLRMPPVSAGRRPVGRRCGPQRGRLPALRRDAAWRRRAAA